MGTIRWEGDRSCSEERGVRGSGGVRTRGRRRAVAVASGGEAEASGKALAAVGMVVAQNGMKDHLRREK